MPANNTQANNLGNQNIDNYSVKLDIAHPVKWANFTYGSKLSFSNTESEVKYYDLSNGTPELDSNRSDNFEYQENIQALYFDIAKKFGKKWQVKLGLRYEHTNTKSFSKTYDKKNTADYGKLFPSAYALYLLNKNNFLNLNYGRRINRPGFWELNPFRWYINTNSYAEGNPFIQPSYTHNIELTHIFKRKLLSTFIIQLTEDIFGEVPLVNAENNQQIYTRENFGNMKVFGIAEIYKYSPFDWWRSTNQLNILYNSTNVKNEYDKLISSESGFFSKFNTQNSITLNKKKTILGEINFNYKFPSRYQFFKVKQTYSLDLALKARFLDNDLIVTISVNDIFKTSTSSVLTYTGDIKQIYNNYHDNRYFKFSLSYNIGNKKVKVQKRNFGNEDEQKRTNKER